MARRLWMSAVFAAGLVGAFLAGNRAVVAQDGMPTFAAVPGELGGQDIWGAYEPDADWPREISEMPGKSEAKRS